MAYPWESSMSIWEECVFCCIVLFKSVNYTWSNIPVKATVSLLTFCLDDLSVDVSGVLNVPYNYFVVVSSLAVGMLVIVVYILVLLC